jgi:electron transport complex protein RnfD
MAKDKRLYNLSEEEQLKAQAIVKDRLVLNDHEEVYEVDKLLVTSSPHTFSKTTTTKIMLDVIIALLPATIASIIFFGLNALLIILTCVASCVFSEWIFQRICKVDTKINDLSAVVTGLLLALSLPAVEYKEIWWPCVVGGIIAIVVVKGLFGGLGKNFANPAVTSRIILLLAFSSVGSYVHPALSDVTSGATTLGVLSGNEGTLPTIFNMFIGARGGALGETSALALLIGGIYLICKKIITWHAPVGFIGTTFIIALLAKLDLEFALYNVLSGGIFISAIFMATDYVTTPSRPLGRFMFGIGAGFITIVIRLWGGYPEGVSFGILFMNIVTPYIDRLTEKRPFGGVR